MCFKTKPNPNIETMKYIEFCHLDYLPVLGLFKNISRHTTIHIT